MSTPEEVERVAAVVAQHNLVIYPGLTATPWRCLCEGEFATHEEAVHHIVVAILGEPAEGQAEPSCHCGHTEAEHGGVAGWCAWCPCLGYLLEVH